MTSNFSNNIGISTNDAMLAWILMQVVHVVKVPNSQAAILVSRFKMFHFR